MPHIKHLLSILTIISLAGTLPAQQPECSPPCPEGSVCVEGSECVPQENIISAELEEQVQSLSSETIDALEKKEQVARTGRLLYFVASPLAYISVIQTLAFTATGEFLSGDGIPVVAITGGCAIILGQTGTAMCAATMKRTRKLVPEMQDVTVRYYENRQRYIAGECAAIGAMVFTSIGTPLAIIHDFAYGVPFFLGAMGLLVWRDFMWHSLTKNTEATIKDAVESARKPELSFYPFITTRKALGVGMAQNW